MYKGVEIDMRYVRVVWNLINETSLSNDPSIDEALRYYSPPHTLSAGFILMLLKKKRSMSHPFSLWKRCSALFVKPMAQWMHRQHS